VEQVADLGQIVGERVRRLRDDRGWSAQRLAQECARRGVDSLKRTAISKVENNRRKLSSEEVLTLAKVLGVTADYLLEGKVAPEPADPAQADPALTDRALTALTGADLAPPGEPPSGFRDRRNPLDRFWRGVASAGGPHFWLAVAPPRLGKTQFLAQVNKLTPRNAPASWSTRLVDLHEHPPDVRDDSGALLALLFGLESPVIIKPETLRGIAQQVSRSGKSHLGLLDSAELLDQKTAASLRSHLSHIYHLVQKAGNADVRVAFIAASRRDDEWRNVSPAPRFSLLTLPAFDADVMEEALRDLARQMSRNYSDGEFRQYAVLIHRLTEGMPPLLEPTLRWIQAEEWLDLERLEESEHFRAIAGPYASEVLLAADSLSSPGGNRTGPPLLAMQMAVEKLVPYRLFTRSHLRHHLEADPAFRKVLADAKWTLDDLWAAVSKIALLKRPLDEPWQEFDPAIRRLLFRYCYESSEQRAAAHAEAQRFVKAWMAEQSGKEQVIGLVECLWHEAALLRLEHTGPAGDPRIVSALRRSAGEFSGALHSAWTGAKHSPAAYSEAELRAYAADRISSDEEFQQTIGNIDGLTDSLIEIVGAQL
jgi:transcriptional regulator with XRE-family HTH domain